MDETRANELAVREWERSRQWTCDTCGQVYVPGDTRPCVHLSILEASPSDG